MTLTEVLQPLHGLFMISAFLLGACVGSFCNVCACRWPAGESVIAPRSRCPKCLNSIAWYDNIPLISWLILGAKCRHCKTPISIQYPIVEALTGVFFLAVYWRFGFVIATPVYMLFCAGMVIITFQDLADWTIPNQITMPGIPIGIMLALVGMAWQGSGLRVTDVFDSILGALLGAGILFAMDRITVFLLKKPGMGFGDVKLLAMVGAFLGWQGTLGTLVIASMVGSVVGVGMIMYFNRYGSSEETANAEESPDSANETTAVEVTSDDDITLEGHYLPFGPYLALGAIIYLFVGPEIIDTYFSIISTPSDPIIIDI